MDAYHDLSRPVATSREGVGGWRGGEGDLARLVLDGGGAKEAAEFGCCEHLGFGAFRTDGGEEGGV